MKSIPKKYLESSQTSAALQSIRGWVASGLSPRDMILQLFNAYSTARTRRRKTHLLTLIAAVAETINAELAATYCCELGLDDNQFCLLNSIGYLADACTNGQPLRWRRRFTERVTSWRPIHEPFGTDMPQLFHPIIHPHILTIDRTDRIFAIGASSCAIDIVIANDCNDTVLADEEQFGDDDPLYFTESTHFTSPVFKVNLVRDILSYILLQIGFPPIPICSHVAFVNSESLIINRDEYTDHPQWLNVDIRTFNDLDCPGDYFFESLSYLFRKYDGDTAIVDELKTMLVHAIAATAIAYETLFDLASPHTLTTARLKRITSPLLTPPGA